jgi:hypothetical protein
MGSRGRGRIQATLAAAVNGCERICFDPLEYRDELLNVALLGWGLGLAKDYSEGTD